MCLLNEFLAGLQLKEKTWWYSAVLADGMEAGSSGACVVTIRRGFTDKQANTENVGYRARLLLGIQAGVWGVSLETRIRFIFT